MSSGHHQHRHNSSLSRAIRAQTGVAAFPYTEYAPMNYDAKYDAYGGIDDQIPIVIKPKGPQPFPIPDDVPPPTPEPKSYRQRRGQGRTRVLYGRKRRGFNGYGEVDPLSAGITALSNLIGVGVKTAVTAGQTKRLQDAELAAQEQRLRLELASNERSIAAQMAASANAAVGGHGKTILISLSVLGLLGGGLYFVLRKKKK